MLKSVNLIDDVVIVCVMGCVVEVGDLEFEFPQQVGSRVGLIVAIRHGAVTFQEGGRRPCETQFRIAGVVMVPTMVQINHIDVPVVFVASVGRLRLVDDACVIVEAKKESVDKELGVGDRDHDLFKVVAVVFLQE